MKIYCPDICGRLSDFTLDKCYCTKTNHPYTDVVCYHCQSIIATFEGHINISEDKEPQ